MNEAYDVLKLYLQRPFGYILFLKNRAYKTNKKLSLQQEIAIQKAEELWQLSQNSI